MTSSTLQSPDESVSLEHPTHLVTADLAGLLAKLPEIRARASAFASAMLSGEARTLLADVEQLLRIVEVITTPVEVAPIAPSKPGELVPIDPLLVEVGAAVSLLRSLLGPTSMVLVDNSLEWREARWAERKEARASSVARWTALRDAVNATAPRFDSLRIEVMPIQRFRTSKNNPWMTAITVRVIVPARGERRVVASLEQ